MKSRTVIYSLALMVAMFLTAGDETESESLVRQDHQYMVDLGKKKGHGPLAIDFTDPKQYRFVMNRLKQAGKTATHSPYLFQTIEAQAANSDGNADQPDQSAQLSGDPNFSIAGHFPLNLTSDDDLNYEATALTTVQNGTDYTFIDVSAWDVNWNQVGTLGWNEAYAAGTEVIADCTGEFPDGPDSLLYIDTLQMYQPRDKNGEQGEVIGTYTYELMAALPGINLEEPRRSTAGVSPQINVCLNRSFTDCDYISMGDQFMRLPFRGSYRLTERYHLLSFEPGSTLTLLGLEGSADGGIAKFIPTIVQPIEVFFTHRQEGLNEYIDWAFTEADGHFGSVIFAPYATVNWFLKIKVMLSRVLTPHVPPREVIVDINSYLMAEPVEITGYPLLPIGFIYSCLASGTEILLPDGSSLAIEDVVKGQPVRGGNGMLTVLDTSVGVEQLPMIKIRDERGRTLLLTEGHPLLDSGGEIRLASELKVGQSLTTNDGMARLVSVEKELYPGHVFNLKLGTCQELASMPEHSNTMYANGFLVGDMEMQKEQQFKQEKTPLLSRLPKAWHQDYHHSQNRLLAPKH